MANRTISGGRMARLLDDSGEAWYHVYNRLAAGKDEMPLEQEGARETLIKFITYYSSAYQCELATYTIMGNHYHLIVKMAPFQELSREELVESAKKFYPNTWEQTKTWSDEYWAQFNRRLFSLSELMRNVQQGYARWFNKTFHRRGKFWADRFKSTILLGEAALMECMQYVDLNPIRAKLVERPEAYAFGAFRLRHLQQTEGLTPLSDLLSEASEVAAFKQYRSQVYLVGEIPRKENDASIDERVLEDELERNFEPVAERRWRFMVDGLVLGSLAMVSEFMDRLRRDGRRTRRKHPKDLDQYRGGLCSLREQRGHGGGGHDDRKDPMWTIIGC